MSYSKLKFLTICINLVEYYRKFYSNKRIDVKATQLALRHYKKVIRNECQPNKRRRLEEILIRQKEKTSEEFFNNYKLGNSLESGDFLVFEFFKVVLPLVTGIQNFLNLF